MRLNQNVLTQNEATWSSHFVFVKIVCTEFNFEPGSKMSDGRKFFVGGNWKMNGSKAKVDEILKFMNDGNFNGDKVG